MHHDVCEGGSRRGHHVSSLRQNGRVSLDVLQALVGLKPTLHLPAGDIVIGKSCPPLDAKI